jgi:hypothetical protein
VGRWHVENGCNRETSPEAAKNFDVAQAAALKYILEKYKLGHMAISSS